MRSVFRRAAIADLLLVVSLSACAPTNDPAPATATVVPGTERQLDPKAWTLTPPAAGATNALRVAFPEPLEHALLRALGVLAPDGSPLPGDVFAGDGELMWQFTPKVAWPAGQYHLVAFGKTLIPFSVR